jgi:hypothetical protein
MFLPRPILFNNFFSLFYVMKRIVAFGIFRTGTAASSALCAAPHYFLTVRVVCAMSLQQYAAVPAFFYFYKREAEARAPFNVFYFQAGTEFQEGAEAMATKRYTVQYGQAKAIVLRHRHPRSPEARQLELVTVTTVTVMRHSHK